GSGARLSVPEAARRLGLAEEDLVALMREAGVRLEGPVEGWMLDAADVDAVTAERERLAARNLRALQRLSEELGEGWAGVRSEARPSRPARGRSGGRPGAK